MSRPTTGSRPHRSRPPAAWGLKARRGGPAHLICWLQTGPGNAPLLLLPRFEPFFETLVDVLAGHGGNRPKLHPLLARSLRVQWSWPEGPWLQARTMRWASPAPPGRGFSSKAPFRPSSRYKRLVRHTVPGATSSASTMRPTPQPASAFSRIRARATVRAGHLPPRIRLSSCARSSSFNCT